MTPVWFYFDDRQLWIATAAGNTKARLLARDGRIAIAIDGTADAPLVAEGTVTIRNPEPELQSVRRAFSVKYGGWDAFDPAVDGERVLLQVSVKRWLLAS